MAFLEGETAPGTELLEETVGELTLQISKSL